jgi:diadenylate cyclase
MPQLPESLRTFFDTLHRMNAASALDILLIAVLIYAVLVWLKGSSGMTLVRGAAIVVVTGLVVGSLLNLTVVTWLLRNSVPALLVAVPIVFQPELRRALERLGRTRVASRRGRAPSEPALAAVTDACVEMSALRLGALIVLERDTGLDDYVRTGTTLDATPNSQLLVNLFWRNSPLHDGAVVLQGSRVAAAGCTLPLSEAVLPYHLGTRHRAALGLAERTDALVIVVSEETGSISLAVNGQLTSGFDDDRLRTALRNLAGQADTAPLHFPRVAEPHYDPGQVRGWRLPRSGRRH